MSSPGIAGIGAYAPRLRISADAIETALGRFDAPGVERKAVPEADEDALTMAHEAASRALSAAGRTGGDVTRLWFATTTPPMAEEDLTARLASTLGAPATARTYTLTGSTRAGGQALDAALEAGPWEEGLGLVVASDCPRGAPDDGIEHAAGAGAVAFAVSPDGPGTVEARATHVEPYPGTRYRPAGEEETTSLGVTEYERQSFETVLSGATGALAVEVGTVDAAAVQSPDGDLPYRVADALGVDAERIAVAETASRLGDTGAASAFLGVANALEEGAERVLLVAYGSGAGANAFVLSGGADVPIEVALDGDADLTYSEYLRRRGVIARDEPAGGGAYVSVPSWWRTIPHRHRLEAGRCPACGALAFPPEGSCPDCESRPSSYERVELPGTGTVEAVTTVTQGGAPPEFVEQQSRSGPYVSAIVALDGPAGEETASVPMQVVAGADESVAVGAAVETTIRLVYRQEGVIRYGIKARLADVRG